MPLGITSCLYLNGGTPSVPTWVLVDLISDNKVDTSWNEGESSVRRGRVQTFEPTNLALGLEGKIRKDINDPAFTILLLAHRGGNWVDILCLDGPIGTVGSDGVRFVGKVTAFSEDQALQNVTFKDFTIKPTMEAPVGYEPSTARATGGGAVTYNKFGT